MSNYENTSQLRAAVDRERKKSGLREIYIQKYKNLKGGQTVPKPVVHKVKVNYNKAPRKRRSSPKNHEDAEIYYTETEYQNMPKTNHDIPERRPDETFEEYYARVRSGI